MIVSNRSLTLMAAAIVVPLFSESLPGARNSHAMASAGPDGGVVLLGGAAGNAPRLVDTLWSWTGASWRPLSDAGPRSRNLPAAAFDTRRRVVVVYGGQGIGSGTRYGDTWEWDGQRWTERNVRTPGPRDHHAMAFDEARGVVVMFGGNGSNGTWTWDGNQWTLADSSSGPGPLAHHAMSYDRRRQRVVMYGGIPVAGGARLSDTWEWSGSRWERALMARNPGARSHHRMAYDAVRGVTVLFGGGDSASTETWTYDGHAWQRHDVPGPGARWSHAMAWDETRQRVVLFGGGRGSRPFGPLADTWEWDGSRWVQR